MFVGSDERVRVIASNRVNPLLHIGGADSLAVSIELAGKAALTIAIGTGYRLTDACDGARRTRSAPEPWKDRPAAAARLHVDGPP